MYERHFGLSAKPFSMAPDPTFLYMSRQHDRAAAMLEYAMVSHVQFALVTGDIGSGKTTLLRRLLRSLDDSFVVGLISNTHQSFQSLHPWIASALGLRFDGTSDVAFYEALVGAMVAHYAAGKRTLLVIDEAQNLPVALLEQLRVLSNMNSEQDVALQVLLIGQPELRETLARPDLRQFAQRISVDCHLRPLAPEDTAAYVRHRLAVAGRTEALFEPAALALVHESSGGVPRLINQLCDAALLYGFADGRTTIDEGVLREVLADRGVQPPAPPGGERRRAPRKRKTDAAPSPPSAPVA